MSWFDSLLKYILWLESTWIESGSIMYSSHGCEFEFSSLLLFRSEKNMWMCSCLRQVCYGDVLFFIITYWEKVLILYYIIISFFLNTVIFYTAWYGTSWVSFVLRTFDRKMHRCQKKTFSSNIIIIKHYCLFYFVFSFFSNGFIVFLSYSRSVFSWFFSCTLHNFQY